MSTNDEILSTTKQVATRLHLSESTLAKMRLDGRGPTFVKLGRKVAYRQGDVEEWVAKNRFQSTSQYDGPKA